MGQLVAVTGASGFAGRHVVRELLSRGFGVRALVSDADKAARVLPEEAEIAGASDLFGGQALAAGVDRRTGRLLSDSEPALRAPAGELFDGVDACVHLIGIIREANGRTFRGTHVEATRHVVDACERFGVPRFVHMSALGARPEGVAEYQRTKFEGERIVRASSLDWTIFRPGLIHGPGSGFMEEAKGWVTGRTAPFIFLPYFTRGHDDPVVQPVAVEDVAWAFGEALVSDESIGEVYNLVGPDTVNWADLLVAIRDRVPDAKKNLHPYGIPGKRAAAMARVAALTGMGESLPFDRGMALMGSEDSTATLDKARKQLGFEPRGFVETLNAYASRL